ncbi:hypothetical protein [Winogradskyella algicola]|uniref:hypothetical protein n=1 Tax=Winogradskyella algicola TaxID=2575815 RepID=UPI001107E0B0|nr:hypothetical protein [Winogradskyella algicola]
MRYKYFGGLILILIIFSCDSDKNIIGNYYICEEDQYLEVYFYFKKDSMRIAADNSWVRLSEWRKIKIQNDTLHFETFGEWRDSSKALIIQNGINKILFYYFESSKDTMSLVPVLENLNFENSEEFWVGFRKRQKSSKCKME